MTRAMPGLKATCDHSLPSPMPKWPNGTPPAPKPTEECRLTECGIPYGPEENQLPAGVGQHGIANCNGCAFHLDPTTQTMTLNGTPTSPIPTTSMSWYRAVLNTDVNTPFEIHPQFGQAMNGLPVSGMQPSTSQASITWTIQVTGMAYSITTTTPLAPN